MEFRTVEIEDTMPNVSGTTSGLAAGVERKERGSLQFGTMIRRGARGLHLDSVSAVGIPGNRGCIPAQADGRRRSWHGRFGDFRGVAAGGRCRASW